MTRLDWDIIGDREYYVGVDQGVFYPIDGPGVTWNGLVSITEAPTGGEPMAYYYDGVKYRIDAASEEFGATLQAYTYPDAFAEHDGSYFYDGLGFSEQPRKTFNLSYRTKVGNDVDGIQHGYKIHLIYNVMAFPTQRANSAMGETPDPINFSWVLSAVPVVAMGVKPTAHLTIDSRKTNPRLMREIEDILYGTATTAPRFPTADELVALYAGALEIIFNGVSGLSGLIAFQTHFDLMGNQDVGVYSIPSTSRLVSPDGDGFYSLGF